MEGPIQVILTRFGDGHKIFILDSITRTEVEFFNLCNEKSYENIQESSNKELLRAFNYIYTLAGLFSREQAKEMLEDGEISKSTYEKYDEWFDCEMESINYINDTFRRTTYTLLIPY